MGVKLPRTPAIDINQHGRHIPYCLAGAAPYRYRFPRKRTKDMLDCVSGVTFLATPGKCGTCLGKISGTWLQISFLGECLGRVPTKRGWDNAWVVILFSSARNCFFAQIVFSLPNMFPGLLRENREIFRYSWARFVFKEIVRFFRVFLVFYFLT